MSGNSHNSPFDYLRKTCIVSVLLGIVILLNHYVPNGENSALISLGFVVLAAYLIGEIVDIIKLPHITGYLLAGLVLGPSLAHTLHDLYPNLHLIPPFDHGLLNEKVISNLAILDTLALPLICLTAGSTLNPREIWSAIRPITGILLGQIITMFVGMIALVYFLSGVVSGVQIDAFVGLPLPALLSIGGLIAAVSLATSDAATIAVVVSTKAKGPMTTNVVSVAVLKDVVVVVAFAAMTTLTMGSLGIEGGESLGKSIQLIFVSSGLGIVLGGIIHLYLKYVKVEILLFLTALIYTVSFVSNHFHLESALMFIFAGFCAKNWSEYGDELISEVERLSAPVFVVFFTLAGAQLHLDVLAKMAVVALLFASVRALAFLVGVRLGSIVFQADEASRKYAWMGFVSQAGLAITLAKVMPGTYGPELGGALFSFILGGVAINEVVGPAMLQSSLALAGEIPKPEEKSPEEKSAETRWFLPTNCHPEILDICSHVQKELISLFQDIHTSIETLRIHPLEESGDSHTKSLSSFVANSTLMVRQGPELLSNLEAISSSLDDHILLPYEESSFVLQENDGRILRLLLWFQNKQIQILGIKRAINPRNIARLHLDTRCAQAVCSFVHAQVAFDIGIAKAMQTCDEQRMKEEIQSFRNALQKLEQDFSLHHHQFCLDLVHVSTFRLPERALQHSFDERNSVVRLLRVEYSDIADALANSLTAILYEDQCQKVYQELTEETSAITQQNFQVWNRFCDDMRAYTSSTTSALATNISIQDLQFRMEEIATQQKNLEVLLSKQPPLAKRSLSIVLEHIQRPIHPISSDIQNLKKQKFRHTPVRSHLTSIVNNKVSPKFYMQFDICIAKLKRMYNLVKEQQDIVEYAKNQDKTLYEEILVEPLRRSFLRFEKQFSEGSDSMLAAWEGTNSALLSSFEHNRKQFTDLDDIIIQAWPIWESIKSFLHKKYAYFKRKIEDVLQKDIARPVRHFDSYERLFAFDMYRQVNMLPSYQRLKNEIQAAYGDPGLHILLGEYELTSSFIQMAGLDARVFTLKEETDEPFWNTSGDKNILIGIHWLFRDKNREASLHTFVRHVLANPKQSWLIVIDPYVWTMLSKRFLLSNFLTHTWSIPALSREELAEALLARHQLSGFEIQYPNVTLWDRLITVNDEDAKKRFFSYLHQKSEGDVHEAILLWLSAIQSIQEDIGQLVMVHQKHNLSAVLHSLSVSQLMLMRQILLYGWIDVSLVQTFFCCPQEKAEAWISYLYKAELIYPKNNNWHLVPRVRFSLIAVLKERGWV